MGKPPAKRMEMTTPQSPIVRLFHPSQYLPVRKRLMKHLNTLEVLRLCQTSKELRSHLQLVEWDINKKLKPFFDDPISFRSCLGRCDALIFGDFALQFLERAYWADFDLESIVQNGSKLEELAKHVTEVQGFTWDETYTLDDEKNMSDDETAMSNNGFEEVGVNQQSH
ncbi:Uu.00g019250.m01.CDS01 [Anthostomella pinea]|uniref:Uu.00g019250.m01.CDS01 n=1 Tax=Anthostomella pinea TaxID=933095 RepID=A0AAI8YQT4_9PEZI|nr:Uu.00g019250.m01.CDS01 [Anthostomella pinea]